MADEPRRRGRPRREEAATNILDAALALLRAGGYRELTLDEVARRAGVAKTTIYRRWPSKAALAAEIVRTAAPASFQELVTGGLRGVVASLIGEAQESAETRAIVQALIQPYRQALGPEADVLLARLLLE
jgi:AcrR family transcriptional regulator